MIVEMLIAAGVLYAYNYLNKSDERKIKNDIQEILMKSGIKNRENETYSVKEIKTTNYGYIAYLNNVPGLSVEHLKSKINILQDNLNAIVSIEKERFKPYTKLQIVNKDISQFKFTPVKCESHQLFIGKDFKGKEYLINLNKDPHILIGGATGTGKSFLLASILTNLIYNSSDCIDMYLFQICKSEISAFESCNCIKRSCYSVTECINAMNEIILEMDKRSELFKKYGIKNITQWNKRKKDYMKRIVVVLEEISFFQDADLEDTGIWSAILKIAKAGRSVGIHLISCVQRSTATNIPPDLKSQMTRISFKQKSSIDSMNIINTTDATTLNNQECIIDGNSDYCILKTPWIDEDYKLLNKYVPEIRIPGDEPKINVFKKTSKKIYTIEESNVIDIEDFKEVPKLEAPKKKNKKKGVISLEEFNANRKRP